MVVCEECDGTLCECVMSGVMTYGECLHYNNRDKFKVYKNEI